MGYDLNSKEIKVIKKIYNKSYKDLVRRKIKPNYDSLITASIYGVTYFTRKLKSNLKGG